MQYLVYYTCFISHELHKSHLLMLRSFSNMTSTYYFCSIVRYTRDLPPRTVDSLVESAFSVWARASSLTFVRSQARDADIMVEFTTKSGFLFYEDI